MEKLKVGTKMILGCVRNGNFEIIKNRVKGRLQGGGAQGLKAASGAGSSEKGGRGMGGLNQSNKGLLVTIQAITRNTK